MDLPAVLGRQHVDLLRGEGSIVWAFDQEDTGAVEDDRSSVGVGSLLDRQRSSALASIALVSVAPEYRVTLVGASDELLLRMR